MYIQICILYVYTNIQVYILYYFFIFSNIEDLKSTEYYFKYRRNSNTTFYDGRESIYDGPFYWLDDIEVSNFLFTIF